MRFLQKTFSQIKYFFLRKIQVNFEKKVLINKKKDFSCLPMTKEIFDNITKFIFKLSKL